MEHSKSSNISNILYDFHDCFKDTYNITFMNNNCTIELHDLPKEITLQWIYNNKFTFIKEYVGDCMSYSYKQFVRNDIKLIFIPELNILELIQ